MLSTNELTLAILAVLVILDVVMFLMNGILKRIEKRNKDTDKNINLRWFFLKSFMETHTKAVTQMRKRDENLLRELHKSMIQNGDRHDVMLDKFSDEDTKLESMAKRFRTVENILGKCKNESISVKEATTIILKEFKKFGTTAESLDKIVKKAETARKTNGK